MKKIPLSVSLILIALAAVLSFQITNVVLTNKYEKEVDAAYESASDYGKLAAVDKLFRSLYVGEIDEDALMDGIISGYMAGSGDRYAMYYNAEDFKLYIDSMNGDMQGIGVHVVYNSEYGAIEIINVMPDSPAMDAGLLPGDLVVYVGEEKESVAEMGYYVALTKLQGKAGTTAVFTVARGKHYEELVDFSIVRAHVEEQTVTSRVSAQDAKVGIVCISSFDTKTPGQFFEAVESLLDGGCEKLVLDVRNNPGGELTSICSVLDYLLPEGPVIRTVDKNGNEKVEYVSDKEFLDVPMAVLVNGSTASAGELFCSALQDYGAAEIIGTQTYGKGTMQTIRQLPDGSGVSITYRYYCPPYSDNYDGVGVTPDTVVEPEGDLLVKSIYTIADADDNQLQAALRALAEK